jgi:hypothetical protein
LEHVIGSQSLVAAVGHAITLHSLNFLTLALLAFWALSPLGGQSALRLAHETNKTISESRPVFYASVDAESQFPLQTYNVDAFNRVNGVVSTTLLTADNLENAPVDTWNHPKIPRIAELEQGGSRLENDQTWYSADRDTSHSYASLTGVNVINLTSFGNTNVTIPYEYMYFDCKASVHNNLTNSSAASGAIMTSPNQKSQMNYLHGLDNAKQLESGKHFTKNSTSIDVLGRRGFFFYTTGNATRPAALIYGSKEIALTFYLFECSMHSIMVEANIICSSDTCAVDRLRRLNIPRAQRKGKYLPYDVVNNASTSQSFVRHLAAIGGNDYSFAMANPVDTYIYGGTPWSIDEKTGQASIHNWTQTIDNVKKMEDMSHRLTRFANTFWDASRWPVAMTRNDPFARSSMDAISGEPNALLTMTRTEALVTRPVLVYRTSIAWTICLVLCSTVLLLLGILSFALSFRIVVPDIFDYVSSFTRDNPYVSAPGGGSFVDGAERARLLRHVRVQLGDVEAGKEVGYITVRSVEGLEDCEQGKVQGTRLYR